MAGVIAGHDIGIAPRAEIYAVRQTSARLSELYGTELHLAYVDAVDRIACVSGRL